MMLTDDIGRRLPNLFIDRLVVLFPPSSQVQPSWCTPSRLVCTEKTKTLTGALSGVGLIEVMVALIILTTGLLGTAALQGLGTRFNNKAYYRSQAITQAYSLIDAMRANPAGVAHGGYVQDPMPSYPAVTNCSVTVCSTMQIATFDLSVWNDRNADLLPGGEGTVTNNGDVYTVQVSWLEESSGDGIAETRRFSMEARL